LVLREGKEANLVAATESCHQDMGEKKCEKRHRMGDTTVNVEK
jgi:hypothetical protein